MKKIILFIIFAAIGWQAFSKYKTTHSSDLQNQEVNQASELNKNNKDESNMLTRAQSKNFQCDGRTYCSQMTSCEEATFFIKNCPNTKMDGNNDGIPCEKQWCK